jgi:hypothetical protein
LGARGDEMCMDVAKDELEVVEESPQVRQNHAGSRGERGGSE